MWIPSKLSLVRPLHQTWRWCSTTHHGRVVTLGLIAGLFYLPTYITVLWEKTSAGYSIIVLNLGFLYLGLTSFWANRQKLQATKVLMDDRLIGHFMILAGALWIPFTFYSVSLQAFLWMIVLIGIAWSSFTPRLFGQYPLASGFILFSVYPDYVWLSNRIDHKVPSLVNQMLEFREPSEGREQIMDICLARASRIEGALHES